MKKLFTYKMFLLLLLPVLLLAIASYVFLNAENIGMGTWGINKTVGWAWDITNFSFLQFLLYPIYLIGYGLLLLFKIRTNYKLSLLHLGLIALSIVTFSNASLSFHTFYLTVLSLLAFLTNIAYSISFKVKNKRT